MPPLLIDQPSLQGFCPIADAVDTLASQADADGRGAVNTRPDVVGFMLDLVGDIACQPLYNKLRECCITRPQTLQKA